MPEKYRKITRAEFEALTKNDESILVTKARDFVSRNYPETAHKVFVRVNSEYNDNYYDIRPMLVVLDKKMDEVDPKTGYVDPSEIFKFMSKSSWGLEISEPIENFTFFMNREEKPLPELYVKVS